MSSVLRRIFRREGTSKLEFTSDVDKANPPTHIPELIRAGELSSNDPDHLEKVADKDPLANFIVYGVADTIFDDGFKFVDKDGTEIMLSLIHI